MGSARVIGSFRLERSRILIHCRSRGDKLLLRVFDWNYGLVRFPASAVTSKIIYEQLSSVSLNTRYQGLNKPTGKQPAVLQFAKPKR